MNSLLCSKIWYSITILIDLVQNRPNSLCQTEYRSSLLFLNQIQANKAGVYPSGALCVSVLKRLLVEFTAFYFLHNLPMGPISQSVT